MKFPILTVPSKLAIDYVLANRKEMHIRLRDWNNEIEKRFLDDGSWEIFIITKIEPAMFIREPMVFLTKHPKNDTYYNRDIGLWVDNIKVK